MATCLPIERVRWKHCDLGIDGMAAVYSVSNWFAWLQTGQPTGPDVSQIVERECTAQAALLRCIAGNPFRPVGFLSEWRTEAAVGIANGIYAERAFDRLPVLADALEEAGCDHPDVLRHCRESGEHARGCWVVDGVLGRT
jgi:hypothetical protein